MAEIKRELGFLCGIVASVALVLAGCEEISLEEETPGPPKGSDSGHPAPPGGTNAPPLEVPDGIGSEEEVSSFVGLRPSIALDADGQPHIVADDNSGSRIALFHRIGGSWRGGTFAQGEPGGKYDASRVYVPWIQVDPQNRAWVSATFGVKEFGTMEGVGVWCVENVNTAPQVRFFRLLSEKDLSKGFGIVGVDPGEPGSAIVYSRDGKWVKLDLSGTIRARGQMYCGPTGEKVRFVVAPRQGQPGVWHAAMGGYEKSPSLYQNSLRAAQGLAPVAWTSYSAYPEMESDFRHPGLGYDGKNSAVAYIACSFQAGLAYNVWDGSKMVFPTTALPVVDSAAQFVQRFAPQWAPAKGGGAYLAWSAGGRVRIVRVTSTGTLKEIFPDRPNFREVCTGTSPAICTDPAGNIHLAYVNGGLRYRTIGIAKADKDDRSTSQTDK